MPLESFLPNCSTRSHNPYATVMPRASKPVEELELDDEPFEAANTGLSDVGSDADCASVCTDAVDVDHEAVLGGAHEDDPSAPTTTTQQQQEVEGEEASYCDPHDVAYYALDPSYRSPLEGRCPVQSCAKLFVGQVPYNMTPRALTCLVATLTGRHVVRAEKIIRWTQRHRACGCFHVFCLPEDADAILAATETALIYGSGFYVAANEAQRQYLQAFCADLRQQHHHGGSDAQPVNLVTVQAASSNYTRPQRLRPAFRRQQCVAAPLPPPPPYGRGYGYGM